MKRRFTVKASTEAKRRNRRITASSIGSIDPDYDAYFDEAEQFAIKTASKYGLTAKYIDSGESLYGTPVAVLGVFVGDECVNEFSISPWDSDKDIFYNHLSEDAGAEESIEEFLKWCAEDYL